MRGESLNEMQKKTEEMRERQQEEEGLKTGKDVENEERWKKASV